MTLRLARQIARLTQKELADRAGVDEATISRLENAQVDFTRASYGLIIRIVRDGLGLQAEDVTQLFPIARLRAEDGHRETVGADTPTAR